jgi:hypothetical protein
MKATSFLLLSNALSAMSTTDDSSSRTIYDADIIRVDDTTDFYAADSVVDYDSDIKAKFEQFWTSSEICDNEFFLSSCYIDTRSLNKFGRESRKASCVKRFVHKSCEAGFETSIAGTASDYSDSSTIKDIQDHKTKGCTTRALSNALMVMSRMNGDIKDGADKYDGNKFTNAQDVWTLIKLEAALKSTRQHAHCVINAFLNYMNQCSADDFISEEDMECLSESMQLDCGIVEHHDDTNTDFLGSGSGSVSPIEQEQGAWHLGSIFNVLKEAAENLYDYTDIHTIETHYDYHMKESHLTIDRSTSDQFDLISPDGVDRDDVHYVVPSFDADGSMQTNMTDASIYDTCSEYFNLGKDEAENSAILSHTSDKCYSVSSWSIIFLEDGNPRNMEWEHAGTDKVRAKWNDVQGCGTRLTQWSTRIACCKSYATVLSETPEQAQETDDYGDVIEATLEIVAKDLMYEVDVLSSDVSAGEVVVSSLLLADYVVEPTPDSYVAPTPDSYVAPAPIPEPEAPVLVRPSLYISIPEPFREICQTLSYELEGKTIIALQSDKCNHQSCVLSKLAKCMSEEDAYVEDSSDSN